MATLTTLFHQCIFLFTLILLSSADSEKDLYNLIEGTLKEKQIPGVTEDFLNTKALTELNGFKYEEHKVTTKDGYVLTAHRIIGDASGGHPVIMQHDFMAASDYFLVQERNRSLAFQLADAGFDVWLTNLRGNWYSREHISKSPSNVDFWDFSIHESGYYDMPAFVDKVLKVTGQSQLSYIGHSLGSAVFLIMTSMRTEYNAKIKAAVLMSPVGITPKLQDLKSKAFKYLMEESDSLLVKFNRFGVSECLPRTAKNIKMMREYCGSPKTQDKCLDLIAIAYGINKNNLDRNEVGKQASYLPAGTSLKTAYHVSQIYRYGFRPYDFGFPYNLFHYNSMTPPLYPLKNVITPVALYWGPKDIATSEESVMEMAQIFPNLIKVQETDNYSHFDFIFGINVATVLNNDIISLLQKRTK